MRYREVKNLSTRRRFPSIDMSNEDHIHVLPASQLQALSVPSTILKTLQTLLHDRRGCQVPPFIVDWHRQVPLPHLLFLAPQDKTALNTIRPMFGSEDVRKTNLLILSVVIVI